MSLESFQVRNKKPKLDEMIQKKGPGKNTPGPFLI
jgi:hypothetical protein